jgi:hypothetical protein
MRRANVCEWLAQPKRTRTVGDRREEPTGGAQADAGRPTEIRDGGAPVRAAGGANWGKAGALRRSGPLKQKKGFGFRFNRLKCTEKEFNRKKYLEASKKYEILPGGGIDYLEQLSCLSLRRDRNRF